MVSTRGVSKPLFEDGERVLCYEPDPTKVQVVYDAKIIQHVITNDERGKRLHEFLVHFQGWSASWDRFVPEYLLLKDNDANRQLQQKLVNEFEEVLCDTFTRSNRKQKRKFFPRNPPPNIYVNPDDEMCGFSSAGDESSCEDEKAVETFHSPSETHTPGSLRPKRSSVSSQRVATDNNEDHAFVPLTLPDPLIHILNDDRENIKKLNRLVRIPAIHSVLWILEDFVRYMAAKHLVLAEQGISSTSESIIFRRAQDAIDIAKQSADGLRLMFDAYFLDLLLYSEQERKQFEQVMANIKNQTTTNNKVSARLSANKLSNRRISRSMSAAGASIIHIEESAVDQGTCSFAHNGATSGRSTPASLVANCSLPSSAEANRILSCLNNWSLFPQDKLSHQPSHLCGSIYLLRLMIRMPKITSRMKANHKTLILLHKFLAMLIEYLLERKDDLFDNTAV